MLYLPIITAIAVVMTTEITKSNKGFWTQINLANSFGGHGYKLVYFIWGPFNTPGSLYYWLSFENH